MILITDTVRQLRGAVADQVDGPAQGVVSVSRSGLIPGKQG
jgi:hypothetical protein